MKRRDFLKALGLLGAVSLSNNLLSQADETTKPNIILCMADDQGWGDTGYNGHPFLKTPNLDQMATEGIRFERFYAASAVCSPTRGSCLTGRHPDRYGIFAANSGFIKPEEITVAEVLKEQNYTTGHFGKWHLGTLTTTQQDSNRGGEDSSEYYAPPWDNGFDVCFSTEAKVPTWDPMIDPDSKEPYGTAYWSGPEQMVTENLEGDDSRIIMDRVIPFIQNAHRENTPFLSVIWFHAPHVPVATSPEYKAQYEGHPEPAYWGTLTAMDEQIGRLRSELVQLGIDNNTILWFCSDNGPDQKTGIGSTGSLRERKGSLYEGGIRVPGLLVWPDVIREPMKVTMPCVTSDYFPTIMEILGQELPDRPYDGISLLPTIQNNINERPTPIAFKRQNQIALIDNRYKLYSEGNDSYELYDLLEDPAETTNIATDNPDIVSQMLETLQQWMLSLEASQLGEDYQ